MNDCKIIFFANVPNILNIVIFYLTLNNNNFPQFLDLCFKKQHDSHLSALSRVTALLRPTEYSHLCPLRSHCRGTQHWGSDLNNGAAASLTDCMVSINWSSSFSNGLTFPRPPPLFRCSHNAWKSPRPTSPSLCFFFCCFFSLSFFPRTKDTIDLAAIKTNRSTRTHTRTQHPSPKDTSDSH